MKEGDDMHHDMPVGISDFKDVRDHYYLIDKTDCIAKLIDNQKKVILFTRPRRFGKTLTMSMLDYFFSIEKKDESKNLFSGLAISRKGESYMSQRGAYPVVFLTLKGLQHSSWADMYGTFVFTIQKEYLKHAAVWESPIFQNEEKAYIQRIMNGTAKPFEYQLSILQLTEFLERYFQQKPIVLIDEYDTPIQSAYTHGFYDTAMSFFRNWFNTTLKDNSHLQLAVLTGVLRIAKESIFSGLNNLDVHTILDDDYSDVFGFTEADVRQMARDLGHLEKIEEIKFWYDGYRFGQTDVYNPWSVIQYFAKQCQPKPYWVHTSENSILKELLPHADTMRMMELQALLHGETISATLHDTIIYDELWRDDGALYTMLLTTGYLTVQDKSPVLYDRYALRIPNEEIRQVYTMEILNTIVNGVNRNDFDGLFDALLSGNAQIFELRLQKVLQYFSSSYDVAQKESFYHGFMLGMTALFLQTSYRVASNQESGYGRFDVAIFPKDTKKTGVIMEFKTAASVDLLEARAKEALQQIEKKAYGTEFEKAGIQRVWKYGIAFCGKHVRIYGM